MRDSSVEEVEKSVKKVDKAQKALKQIRKTEIRDMKRVRVHSREQLRLEDQDKKEFLDKGVISGTKKQMEKRSYKTKLNEMLADMIEKHGIQDEVDKDPELKKRLLKDMH